MTLLFLITILKFLLLQLQMKSEYGTPKTDNNYLEFKSLAYSVSQLHSLMMEKVLFQAGLMAKLELFYLNLANYFMLSTMLIIMDAPQLLQPQTDRESYLEERRDKSEFGD